MKIIITDSFKTKYKKIFNLIDIYKLSEKIKAYKLINLKYPYFKLKLSIWNIAIRWILLKTKWWNLVYLILCLKKDKNCWYNMIFDTLKKDIYNIESKILYDLKYGFYTEIQI